MAKDDIPHKKWNIEVMEHVGGWKAFIYPPGSHMSEPFIPTGTWSDKDTVIAEAKRYIDGQRY